MEIRNSQLIFQLLFFEQGSSNGDLEKTGLLGTDVLPE